MGREMKKVAIIQSNYIPWKGYFDIINSVDLFIFHDDLQYTKNDWRNRNKIKTAQGPIWLTIPCGSNEKRLICEVDVSDNSWQKKHWRLISNAYIKAPYFNTYKSFFEDVFLNQYWSNLSDFNQYLIKRITQELIGNNYTQFDDSRNYNLQAKKGERVIELLIKAKANHYLSGPSAKSYLDENKLLELGISVEWFDYSDYPIYPQIHGGFEHAVSIIDLFFNAGSSATEYMKT
jgi:hypothetical protein